MVCCSFCVGPYPSLICVCIVCILQAVHRVATYLQGNQKVLVRDEKICRMAIDMEATQARMNHGIRHAARQNSIMDRALWAALFTTFPWTVGMDGTRLVCMPDAKWFSRIPAGWRPDKLPADRYCGCREKTITYSTHLTIIHHPPTHPGQFNSISNGY